MKNNNVMVSIPKESFLDLAKMFGELAVRTENLCPMNSSLSTEIMFQIMKKYFTPRVETDKKVNLYFAPDKINEIFKPFLIYLRDFKP